MTKTKYITIALILAIATLLTSFGNVAYAANYSDVLADLGKDSNFNANLYPVVADDYSLQVIQLAESVDNELFIYVYQPTGTDEIQATSINISTTINDNISYTNYKLTYLNSNGTLFKYLVNDFVVSTEPTRYYDITSIYRPFDANIDKHPDNGNVITEVAYAVGKQYCFSTINGQANCAVIEIETVEITDKFVGFVRYSNGFSLFPSSCDSHFVAFNTNRPIDSLLEADVYYTQQEHRSTTTAITGTSNYFDDKVDKYAYLKYTDKVEHQGTGWGAGKYTWNRIETVDQFLNENNIKQNLYTGILFDVAVENTITEAGMAQLAGKTWVLRFAETDFARVIDPTISSSIRQKVGDVSILRLKFEYNGVTYNLGAIDNKQTGSDDPINDEQIVVEPSQTIWDILRVIIMVAVLLLAVIAIFSLIGSLRKDKHDKSK